MRKEHRKIIGKIFWGVVIYLSFRAIGLEGDLGARFCWYGLWLLCSSFYGCVVVSDILDAGYLDFLYR